MREKRETRRCCRNRLVRNAEPNDFCNVAPREKEECSERHVSGAEMPLRGRLPLPEDNVASIEGRRIRRARFSRHSLLLRASVPPWFSPSSSRSGFSLIEVVIAAGILGVSLAVLLTAASRCLLVLSMATHYQEAQLVRSQVEVEYPLIVTNELEDIEVPLMTLDNGMTFERVVEEDDEDEDNLYVVTTRIGWTARGAERFDEVVQYVYHEDEDDE